MTTGDSTLFSIGELAERTGLAVRTIRFYSDRGVLPPTDRSPAGHRQYDAGARYCGWWRAAAPDLRSYDSCTDWPSCRTWNGAA